MNSIDNIAYDQNLITDEETLNINWQFSDLYCSLETYKKTVDQIKQFAKSENFKKIHWTIGGAEPTKYIHFLELTKYIEDNVTPYQSVEVLTNLNPDIRYWKKWCFNTEMFQRKYISSIHDLLDDNQDQFIEKCLYLLSENVIVSLSLNYEDPETTHRLIEMGIIVDPLKKRIYQIETNGEYVE